MPAPSARFFHPIRNLERDDKKWEPVFVPKSRDNKNLERDDKKWEPVFVPKSRDNKNLERTFDSIKCDPALGRPVYVDLG